MKTEVILKVEKLENLVGWIARNFICVNIPTRAAALYMFANKPGTSMEDDGKCEYSKFDSEFEAKLYSTALSQVKFIIESELVDRDVIRDDTTNEVIDIKETWKITVTPSVNNTEDAFNMYCPRPYNPE